MEEGQAGQVCGASQGGESAWFSTCLLFLLPADRFCTRLLALRHDRQSSPRRGRRPCHAGYIAPTCSLNLRQRVMHDMQGPKPFGKIIMQRGSWAARAGFLKLGSAHEARMVPSAKKAAARPMCIGAGVVRFGFFETGPAPLNRSIATLGHNLLHGACAIHPCQ